jgi:ATP-binding cassette, subfamily B, bacterial
MLRGILGRFISSGGQGERPALVALRAFLPYARPHWRGFALALVGVIASSLVSLITPWPLKFLVDNVLHVGQPSPGAASPTMIVLGIAGAIVAIAAFQGLFTYLEDFFLPAASERVAFAVRRALFAHMQRLSLAFHDKQRTGDMITRVINDVTKVQELVTDSLLTDGLSSVLQYVGMLTIMFFFNWKLGLVAMVWSPVVVLASMYFRQRIRDQEYHVRQREGNLTSHAQETISSIRVVKAFGRERHALERFEKQAGEMAERNVNVERLEARFSWVMTILSASGLAVVGDF